MAALSFQSHTSSVKSSFHSFYNNGINRLILHSTPSSTLKRHHHTQSSIGVVLGLGTGSTTAFVVSKIGELLKSGELKDIVAISLGIPLSVLDDHPVLDLSIDGVDEVDPDLNLVKYRGGALLREKMVEVASEKFVVVVDDTKLVDGLGGSGLAMPVEVVQFCWMYNLLKLQEFFNEVEDSPGVWLR
ncbi:hypothetical protein MKX01_021319 [Papaver californicum]|nr:hypothetical protein MKX01_021319 [Papaver californicum]